MSLIFDKSAGGIVSSSQLSEQTPKKKKLDLEQLEAFEEESATLAETMRAILDEIRVKELTAKPREGALEHELFEALKAIKRAEEEIKLIKARS